MPSRVTGWVVSSQDHLHEVRLLVGTTLIARAEINQPREDVCEQLKCDVDPGFSLQLPVKLPEVDWNQPIRILALSVDGQYKVELHFLSHTEDTNSRLKSVLQSDFLAAEGHFDGVINGALQGWAAKRRQKKPINIYIHSDINNEKPIKVTCDNYRDEIDNMEFPRQCGFRLPLSKMSDSWRGLSVRCSFDREGLYLLPQNQVILIPKKDDLNVLSSTQNLNTSAIDSEKSVYTEYLAHKHWEELMMYKLILDEIENKLESKNGPSMQKPSALNRYKWILGFFVKSK